MSKPIFPHLYSLYISGSDPVLLDSNTYNNVVQNDNANITITLPSSTEMIDSSIINFVSKGQITINANGSDTINNKISYLVQNGQTVSLCLNKLSNHWYNLNNGGSMSTSASQMIFVTVAGSDTLGDGTINSPYASVEKAMTTITNSSSEKKYTINVGPGDYYNNTIQWKTWVYIVGSSLGAVRINDEININDSSWSNPGLVNDEQAGAQNIIFTGPINIDYRANNSDHGKISFVNCAMTLTVNMLANVEDNQVFFLNCILIGGIMFKGCRIFMIASISFDNIMGSSWDTNCTFVASGGTCGNNLSLSTQGNVGLIDATLSNFYIIGNVIIDGAGTNLKTTCSSYPDNNGNLITNGAILTLLNNTKSVGYTPSEPNKWNPTPNNAQNAIDRMAALLYTLNTNIPIP